MKRRALNVRSEGAGHPFRRMLLPAMLKVAPNVEETQWWKREEAHLFAMSFSAFFLVFYSFIY
jgi:hypothetical protein